MRFSARNLILLAVVGVALPLVVILASVHTLTGTPQEPNMFSRFVYLSEIEEGQAPVTINSDGTSTVLVLDKIESTNGIPDNHYNVVVHDITDKDIVVEIGERRNYDGDTDVVVGFVTTREISPSCVIHVSSYNLEKDISTEREFKR